MTDAFDAIVGDLVLEEPDDVTDVTVLELTELLHQFGQVREELLERREMKHPTTPEGRELHSQRAALLVEMTKRGLRP